MFGTSVTLRNYLDIAKLKLHYTTFDPRPLVNFLIQGTPPPNRKRFLSSLYRLPSSKGRLYLGETFTFPKVFLKEVTLRQFREVLVSQSLHFFYPSFYFLFCFDHYFNRFLPPLLKFTWKEKKVYSSFFQSHFGFDTLNEFQRLTLLWGLYGTFREKNFFNIANEKYLPSTPVCVFLFNICFSVRITGF